MPTGFRAHVDYTDPFLNPPLGSLTGTLAPKRKKGWIPENSGSWRYLSWFLNAAHRFQTQKISLVFISDIEQPKGPSGKWTASLFKAERTIWRSEKVFFFSKLYLFHFAFSRYVWFFCGSSLRAWRVCLQQLGLRTVVQSDTMTFLEAVETLNCKKHTHKSQQAWVTFELSILSFQRLNKMFQDAHRVKALRLLPASWRGDRSFTSSLSNGSLSAPTSIIILVEIFQSSCKTRDKALTTISTMLKHVRTWKQTRPEKMKRVH